MDNLAKAHWSILNIHNRPLPFHINQVPDQWSGGTRTVASPAGRWAAHKIYTTSQRLLHSGTNALAVLILSVVTIGPPLLSPCNASQLRNHFGSLNGCALPCLPVSTLYNGDSPTCNRAHAVAKMKTTNITSSPACMRLPQPFDTSYTPTLMIFLSPPLLSQTFMSVCFLSSIPPYIPGQ